ncbi:hypothetical protein Tco_0458016 [Tanacetum coccineum]
MKVYKMMKRSGKSKTETEPLHTRELLVKKFHQLVLLKYTLVLLSEQLHNTRRIAEQRKDKVKDNGKKRKRKRLWIEAKERCKGKMTGKILLLLISFFKNEAKKKKGLTEKTVEEELVHKSKGKKLPRTTTKRKQSIPIKTPRNSQKLK